MKALNDLLRQVSIRQTVGDVDKKIKQITFDSRKVSKGDLFVAVRGTLSDGHLYIDKAIQNGATVIVGEELKTTLPKGVTYIEVENSSKSLGLIASNYYEHPSRSLQLVGVTGTNGKTTTATLLYNLFMALGYKAGLLSTIENKIGQKTLATSYTTPDAITLNDLLGDMVKAGCDFVFMEVSSHAIDQERIAGLQFAGGIFTNISHDHLDYHHTFKAYIEAKKRFFDDLPKSAFALTNLDDRNGTVMLQNTKAKKHSYSLKRPADFKAKIIDNNLLGLLLEIDEQEIFSRLIGEFNAYNLLTIYATAILLGQEKLETLTALSQLKTAEGRFDYIVDQPNNRIAIVDYAHTPDALEKVLSTIEKLRTKNEQIITVIGCGGDRDKMKRPKMAKIAAIYSNQVILTSDNPRSESPESIITDMEQGLPRDKIRKVLSITNREQAIKTACRLAQNGDIILVAGKGHEKYQEIDSVKHPFDDKQKLKQFLLGN